MAARTSMRDRLRRPVERFRRGGPDALRWTLRLTTAAVASYVVAVALLPTERPLLAPLTALLVVQATPVSLLTTGLDRVVSVVVGVLLAVAVSAAVPLTWWSLAVVIAVSLALGQALRLRSNLLEVPISAMLVLGVGSTDTAAWDRAVETFIGAGVGILANLLLPPRVPYANAAEAVDDIAVRLARLLRRAGAEVAESEGDRERIARVAEQCLDDARGITADVPRVMAALEHVEEGRKLNVRVARDPNPAPGIRQGLEVLEHVVVALRSLFRGVRDAALDDTWPVDDLGRDAASDLVEVLEALARSVEAFGDLVRTEATAADLQAPENVRTVQEALDSMHAARSLLFDRAADQNSALAELYVTLGSTVKRLRSELDLEGRARRLDVLRPVRRPVRDVINPRSPRRRPHA